MKVNWIRAIGTGAWLLLTAIAVPLFPYIVHQTFFGFGWTLNALDGRVVLDRVPMLLTMMSAVVALSVFVTSLCHIFNAEWSFFEAMARKFPKSDPPPTNEPTQRDWR